LSAKIYAEGGGDGPLLDTLFRQAWSEFFKAAGLSGRMPGVVRGQGRTQTFDMFKTAIQAAKAGVIPMLLVDAEDTVQAGHSVWQHLKARDGWDQPAGAAVDQAFLMVRIMETWFVADRNLLVSYFGADFRPHHLPKWPHLEDVAKPTLLAALARATAGCTKPYSKGKVSFELLGQVDPSLVESACPHAKALLDKLRTL
jgi:hypothetical protein